MDLNFKVDGQMLACTNMQEIVTDSTKYIYANFTFSSDWASYGKTAEFKNSNIDQGYVQNIVGNKCEVPHEVMTANGKLTVCVKGIMGSGTSQSIIHTKMRTPLRLRLSDKVDCVNSVNPTPTELEQLENAVGQIQTNFGGHLTRTDNPHSVTKTQVGLDKVTNDKQVKGLSSGTTNGNLVKFGADGYTVADSGESIYTLKKEMMTNILNPTLQTTTSNGITCTRNVDSNGNFDGTYTVNGTASATIKLKLATVNCKVGDIFKLIVSKSPINGSEYCIVENGTGGNECTNKGKITATSTSFDIYYWISSGVIINGEVIKPMLTTNLSATYDDFVPFTGTSGRLNQDVSVHETSISSIKNDIADQYSVSSTYAIGSLVIYNNSLYKCNTAITVAEAWNSAHWTATTVDAEIIANKNAIATTNNNLAQLLVVEQLTATAATVNANTFGNYYIPVAKEGYTALAVVGASSQANCPLVACVLQTTPQVQVYVCVRNVTAGATTSVAPYVNVLYMKNLS